MSASFNQITIIGTMVRDPETREGARVCNFTLAVNRLGSKEKDKADFLRIAAWDGPNYKLAEICQKLLRKGHSVMISGRLEISQYEKDGQKRESAQIVAREMQLLTPKGASGENGSASHSGAESSGGSSLDADVEEEIPF